VRLARTSSSCWFRPDVVVVTMNWHEFGDGHSMKTPGGRIAPSRRALIHSGMWGELDHPKHDGANKGDGCIRGNNAHFADPRTQQGHRDISVVHVTARSTLKASNAFPPQKVSLAALLSPLTSREAAATWLKECENKALKSP